MINVNASCTDLKYDERTKINKLIEWMGGSYRGDLGAHTTHLICNTVGSKKYIVATQLKIPILKPDWVYTAYEMRKRQIFEKRFKSTTSKSKLHAKYHTKCMNIKI